MPDYQRVVQWHLVGKGNLEMKRFNLDPIRAWVSVKYSVLLEFVSGLVNLGIEGAGLWT